MAEKIKNGLGSQKSSPGVLELPTEKKKKKVKCSRISSNQFDE